MNAICVVVVVVVVYNWSRLNLHFCWPHSHTELGLGVSNSTNKLLSSTPLLSTDVTRLTRELQTVNLYLFYEIENVI